LACKSTDVAVESDAVDVDLDGEAGNNSTESTTGSLTRATMEGAMDPTTGGGMDDATGLTSGAATDDASSSTTGGGMDDATGSTGAGDENGEFAFRLSVNQEVDILFVIDNSGSMGEEQRNLSANFGNFLSVLETEDVAANYRIGITTTDNNNPWCAGGSPEGGNLVLSSCRGRLTDFRTEGLVGPLDQSAACLDFCPEEFANLETIPTTTAQDFEARSRPWLESIDGVTNLPDLPGLTATQALQCFGPQGINGCGFEQHLESMYLSLVRMQTEGQASYGFLRDTRHPFDRVRHR